MERENSQVVEYARECTRVPRFSKFVFETTKEPVIKTSGVTFYVFQWEWNHETLSDVVRGAVVLNVGIHDIYDAEKILGIERVFIKYIRMTNASIDEFRHRYTDLHYRIQGTLPQEFSRMSCNYHPMLWVCNSGKETEALEEMVKKESEEAMKSHKSKVRTDIPGTYEDSMGVIRWAESDKVLDPVRYAVPERKISGDFPDDLQEIVKNWYGLPAKPTDAELETNRWGAQAPEPEK